MHGGTACDPNWGGHDLGAELKEEWDVAGEGRG